MEGVTHVSVKIGAGWPQVQLDLGAPQGNQKCLLFHLFTCYPLEKMPVSISAFNTMPTTLSPFPGWLKKKKLLETWRIRYPHSKTQENSQRGKKGNCVSLIKC